MAKVKCKPCVPATPRANVPPWADPALQMATTATRFSLVSCTMNVVTTVAVADPKRVAIGFAIGSAGGTNAFVAPHDNPIVAGWKLDNPETSVWFYLLKHGPFVNLAWFCRSSITVPVGVFEVYRLSGR